MNRKKIVKIAAYSLLFNTLLLHPGWISENTCKLLPKHFPKFLFDPKVRVSSYPLVTGDTFRAHSDFILDETNFPFDPNEVQTGDVIFLHASPLILGEFFNNYHKKIKNKYIIVTHNHDYPMPGDYGKYLDDPKIVAWFSKNTDRAHPKLICIPVGISNPNWGEHGNPQLVHNALKNVPSLESRPGFKTYLNILVANNVKDRQPAVNYFSNKSFCHRASRKRYPGFLEDLKRFKFVISPPGNGIDCHRTWEALLMGSIPIVKHSTIDPVFDDLPVILINNWSEVTPTFLEKKYKEIISKNYNLDKLYVDYWLGLIKNYKEKARLQD